MINSDLKHVLKNVYCDTDEDIKLEEPIKFMFDPKLNTTIPEIDTLIEHEMVVVYKKGRSWKIADNFDNEWTISTLDGSWQASIYYNLLSMRDSRQKPVNYKLKL